MALGFVGVWFIFLLIVGGSIGLAIREVWRATTRGGVPRQAVCGACGYPVEGLNAGTCPECGRAIAEVGVCTPALASRHRSSGLGVVVSWTYLHAIAGTVLAYVWALTAMSGAWISSAQTTLSITASLSSTPGMNLAVYANEFPGAGGGSRTVNFNLGQTSAGNSVLTVNWVSGQSNMSLTKNDGTFVSYTGDKPIEALFEDAGLNLADPVVVQEAAELQALLDWFQTTPESSWDGGTQPALTSFQVSSRYYSPAGAGSSPNQARSRANIILGTIAIGLLLFWFVGLVLILRRRRKLLAPLHQSPQAA